MPKDRIGYQAASKMSAFRRKKSKDEAALKKPKINLRTETAIRELMRGNALTRKEAEAFLDSKKGKK